MADEQITAQVDATVITPVTNTPDNPAFKHSAGVCKKSLTGVGWAVEGAVYLFLLYNLFFVIKVPLEEWNTFLSAKLPLIATQVAVPLLILRLIDWTTRGRTIETICRISPQSPWQDKAIAAGFMGIIFLGLVAAVKGGF
jgi:phosphotransferase system  glucose/maltose/N-acetylglucosamine-specific IIC component